MVSIYQSLIQIPFTPTLSVVTTTGLILAAVAFTAAYLIARKSRKKSGFSRDDSEQAITSRGEWLGVTIGRFRNPPVFAWVGEPGDRIYTPPKAGGKGSGGSPKQANYQDRGWQLPSVGYAVALHGIYDGERVVWEGELTPADSPAGTTVTTPSDGSFRISSWGSIEGATDDLLTERLGIASGWPYCFSIVWDRKDNGQSANWDQLEYEYTVACPSNSLDDSEYTLTTAAGITGVNPAHAIYQLLTAPSPMGAGLKPGWIDATTLEEMGERCESELLICNMRITGGQTVAATIDLICEDIGYSRTQIGGRLAFLPIRGEASLPTISKHAILEGPPEREGFNLVRASKLLVYSFISRELNYRTQDIYSPNDGTADPRESGAEQREEIYICTDGPTGATISERRSREQLSDPDAISLKVGRDAVHLQPGQSATFEDYGQLRVMGRTPSENGETVSLNAIPDVYAQQAAATGSEGTVVSGKPLAVAQDLAVAVGQLDGALSVVVFRIRAHAGVISGLVHLSSNGGTSYTEIGSQDIPAGGGPLLEALALEAQWAASTAYALDDVVRPLAGEDGGLNFRVTTAGTSAGSEPTWPTAIGGTVVDGSVTWTAEAIATGPQLEPLNDDEPWSSLVSDPLAWTSGSQLLVIGDEVFNVQQVAVVSESDWIASTAYSIDDVVVPTGTATGFRYIATAGGTSDASEPTWPTEAGATVVDSGVTWEAHRFALEPRGLIRSREGTARAAHAVDAVAFIISRASLSPLTDATVQAGEALKFKTQPATSSSTAPLSGATAVDLTVV